MENNMDFRSYEEMLNYVLSISTKEEKARIMEEDMLFEERGWKKYILFIGNCFSEDRKADWNSYGGSARDSYLLYKVSFPDTVNTTLLTNEEAKSILFNDALRVRIRYIHVDTLSKGILEEFQGKLKNMSSVLGLEYNRESIQNNKEKIKEKNEERIIVSNTVIPTEDLDLIKNEKRDSTEEENEVLRKYLIIMLESYKTVKEFVDI
ncbi:MAG: hypothetical protein PUD65_08430 [Spirochaetales bacterium]|nr:hypothetical protein [Spirochaetales bacterium]